MVGADKMRSISIGLGVFIICGVAVVAQEHATDPRVGLKAGMRDAGVAVRNRERIKSIPKPEGFFDPKSFLGTPIPAEQNRAPAQQPPAQPAAQQPVAAQPPAAQPQANSAIDFANSDIAFSHDNLFMGNFTGFTAYTIEDPANARAIASVVCPGGQGDVSIYGNLHFLSVEQTSGSIDC